LHLDEVTIGSGDTAGIVISNPRWDVASESSDPAEPSRLPKYVERGGEAVWRQPSLLFGMRIFGFGVRVAPENQISTLNRYVNDIVDKDPNVVYGHSPFRLVPCPGIDMAMLMFIDYKLVTSGTDDDRRLGGLSYREFLAMQLAFCDDEDFPELDWFIPFIYLDKDSPRLGGREIFGYPKQLGTIPEFQSFVHGGAASKLELTALVLPNVLTSATLASVVTIDGMFEPKIEQHYNSSADMIRDLLNVSTGALSGNPAITTGPGAGPLVAGVDIFNALLSGAVGHVFLKQFRDCQHPHLPCYQAICKLDAVPGKFRGGARVSSEAYRIKINDIDSERLIEYLGRSAAEWQEGVTPDFAYWMDLDAELTAGRVIANPLGREFVPDRSPAHTGERRARRRIRRSRDPAL
jgi:hypothetical protein